MTISAVSQHRGGTIEEATPLAKRMKAIHAKHGVLYRLGRFRAGPNAGDWVTIVQYADWPAYEQAQKDFAQDPEYQQAVSEIRKFTTQISRELVDDIDL